MVDRSMIYIGIDNGLSGALVAISSHPGPPIDMVLMPTRSQVKGNEVDPLAIKEWLYLVGPPHNMTAVLETPGKHSPGVMALCSMWDSYGCIRAVLECLGIRHHRISPQKWQKVMLVGCGKGDTKPAAAVKVRQLWPTETFLATKRSTVPHGGLIDAALIAEYGRLNHL
jgi:hypothetical protein